uniref:Uncharacterized protein n=1 Tax=Acrobeloides nanus TaxID=290746 RepID=A0A914EK48_9BILA
MYARKTIKAFVPYGRNALSRQAIRFQGTTSTREKDPTNNEKKRSGAQKGTNKTSADSNEENNGEGKNNTQKAEKINRIQASMDDPRRNLKKYKKPETLKEFQIEGAYESDKPKA